MSSSKKIIVTFNKFAKPVGDEGNELVQYLGTLVRMADHVGIHYPDWRRIPMQKKEDLYSLVKVCVDYQSFIVLFLVYLYFIRNIYYHYVGKICYSSGRDR